MDRESVNRLRFDRRLEQRGGWVEDGAREEYFEALPDVTDKMTVGLDEEDEATPTEGEASSADIGSAQVGFTAPTPPAPQTSDAPAPSYSQTPNEGSSFGGGGAVGGGSEPS